MKILMSGASGLVGTSAVHELRNCGCEVRELVRRKGGAQLWWDPGTGGINAEKLNEWRPNAFVHLAGENIASHRWNAAQKGHIRDSRVKATELLASSLLKLKLPPEVFVSASAVGYYGDRADELLTERSPPGNDFLARVSRDWEEAACSLEVAGIRVVHLRLGMILSRSGGALARMLPFFKLGLGGRLGSGKQWVSWAALADVVRVIEWVLTHSSARGAYNVVAPHPVTNREFTAALAEALKRPVFVPLPAIALRAIFGEMADALLLGSQRVIPEALLRDGFQFAHPLLTEALRAELTR